MEDLTKKTEAELSKAIEEAREVVRSVRFSLAGGREKNVRRVRETKRTIARLLTELARRA
jgi:ribosomal protein L29